MSMQKLKDQYEALTPKQKKLVTFGGPILIIVFLWMLFSSDEELLKVHEKNVSEVGLFGVNEDEVTVGDVSTRVSAISNQVDLLAKRENTTAQSIKRIEDILSSLDASDANLQTLYEIQRKINELDEKIADVQIEANAPRTDRATISYVEEQNEKVEDPAPGESVTVEVIDPDVVVKEKTANFDENKPTFNYETQRTEIPDDPIAFLNQASGGSREIKSESGNMYINNDNTESIMAVQSTTSVTDEQAKADADKGDGLKYRGKRVLAGAVVPFVLINGFEAATGEAAEEYPTSATVQLTGPAILPNGYSVDLSGCYVTNLVRGDSATERAKMRPDRLTCKYEYGEVDIEVQGFASGHDGSAGIRGRLVNNKRDKILLYGTLTGGLSGLGEAFGGNGSQSQISIGGAYELPSTRDVAIGAGTSGVSNAADFLSEYYQAKLQEYYDVIEVKPLVTGTIHFIKSFKMELIEDETLKISSL